MREAELPFGSMKYCRVCGGKKITRKYREWELPDIYLEVDGEKEHVLASCVSCGYSVKERTKDAPGKGAMAVYGS